jgi:aldehyde dehydrogenase (NAD+)
VGALTTCPALPKAGLFADNTFRDPRGSTAQWVLNPATEAVLGRVTDAGPADVDAAIGAARRTVDGGEWSRLTPRERSDALHRLTDALTADYDRILAVVVAETGCPVTASRGHQVGIPLRHLEYWAEVARRPDLVPRNPHVTTRSDGSGVLGGWAVRREPYGVVAAITPYNFPFLQTVMKVGPALAAGNSMVIKPSPFTPYSTFLIAEAAQRAGLPDGVINVVTGGSDVGDQLVGDPRVDLISFTGSDKVGALIARRAAPRMVRLVLELGGKSPLIVCADADLRIAARAGAQSATYHAGQGCALTTRHLVHHRVREEYLELLAEQISEVKVGDPTDPATGMGPLIRPEAVNRVHRLVGEAQKHGAELLLGGHRGPHTCGYFYEPTVLINVANSAPIARDEIFGPVAVVIDTDNDDHAVALANDSPYGLAGHVVAGDPARAFEMACRLRTGSVDINGGPGYTNPDVPFGGYKNSGLGRENGSEGIDEYTQFKTIKYHAG